MNVIVQRSAALELGNEVRSARAQFKRDLKASANPSQLIAECNNGIHVLDALKALNRVGAMKAREWMWDLQIPERMTLGGSRATDRSPITDAQRERLVEWVRERRG